MKVAIWTQEPVRLLAEPLSAELKVRSAELTLADRDACAAMLIDGRVDVALLAVETVLGSLEDYDILPAVAYSTWNNPYATIHVPAAFDKAFRRIVCEPKDQTERLVAGITIKEHYRFDPIWISREKVAPDTRIDATMTVSRRPAAVPEGMTLDIGQEWYELSNYPMVWGLFVMRKGEATNETARLLRDAVVAVDDTRGEWISALGLDPEFFGEDLRFRLDDLALASLTELRHYLFYMDYSDEIADLPVFAITDEDEESKSPLL